MFFKKVNLFLYLPVGESGAALSRSQRPLSARAAHHGPAMKGYHVSRSLSQHATGPCHCMDCDGPGREFHYHQGHADHHYYPPGGPPEPLALPAPPSSGGGGGGGTFPRSHHSQHTYDSCEECLTHRPGSGVKGQRGPAALLDQFERQLPLHSDGFHTLQYQRSASGGEQPARSESPSRIRHLVHSVQRLFAKSHSLEAPAKREFNGGPHGGARRNKSRERSKSGDSRHDRTAGWWSSDDNLDSDNSFLVTAGRGGGRGGGPGAYHESLDAAIQELTMTKRPKRPVGPGECMACTGIALAGETSSHAGHSLKRSTWSAMTVSQAREVYPRAGGGGGAYEKALVPLESKVKERTLHHLQVPLDEWAAGFTGGGALDSGGEIPCRRMRSGSYVKAMGDDDSGDSDGSPKAMPKSALIAQREAFRRSISMDHRSTSNKWVLQHSYSCKQCTDAYPNSRTTPKAHPRSRSYTRSLTSAQLGETLNRQFEGVSDTMFGEVESQAVEALDLPGCFRTRSHSYVRAIQAGCSQDDDCLSVFSMSGPQGNVKGGAGEMII
uniref:Discs, large (Drosophila) homolog-associated protein 3 n=1 Tax=Denticeps clupeoides TaxID=299321 RepID=A0AAY4DRF0_9TELE